MIDISVLITYFNSIITLILGFIINNVFDRKPYKWIVGAAATVLFFLFIVFINDLDVYSWSTWLYLLLYFITLLIGMIVSIVTRKYRYQDEDE
ncbi:hypothetical protein [Natribacillus halophilus]|uniref:YesK-like protein n=1 Tax=Natribacillus halophilus TaxID=549003 RepID=A0A1G8NH96_9BACI|nr:hypothetical protein [Natribacillus halophilus]SDI78870.1 hypothetical protein SAMN04488123_10655 [Natribacillus halophilus]